MTAMKTQPRRPNYGVLTRKEVIYLVNNYLDFVY